MFCTFQTETSEDKKSRSEEALKRIREKQSGRKILKKLAKTNKYKRKIDLPECDLSEFKDVKFEEGAEVDLTKVKGKLPEMIDFSELNRER